MDHHNDKLSATMLYRIMSDRLTGILMFVTMLVSLVLAGLFYIGQDVYFQKGFLACQMEMKNEKE
jgi:hypothetical protein